MWIFEGFQVNIKLYQAIFLSNTCATNYFPISTIYRDEIMPAGSSVDKVGGLNMVCINQGSILEFQNAQRTLPDVSAEFWSVVSKNLQKGPISSNHGFTCECPSGSELQVDTNGVERCVDINECKTGQHHCGWLPCRDFCAHGSSDGIQGNAWWNDDYSQCIFRFICKFFSFQIYFEFFSVIQRNVVQMIELRICLIRPQVS